MNLYWTPIYCRHDKDEAPAKWWYNPLTYEWRRDGMETEASEPATEPTLFDGLDDKQTPVAAAAE